MKVHHKKLLRSFFSVLLVAHSALAQVPAEDNYQIEHSHAQETEYTNRSVTEKSRGEQSPVTIRRSPNQYHISLDIPAITWTQFTENPMTVFPSIPGFDISSEFNTPVLPKMVLFIALPEGNLPGLQVAVDSLEVLEPPSLPAVFHDTPKGVETHIESDRYQFPQSRFPDERVSISRFPGANNHNLGVIRIFPVRWTGESNQYELARAIDLTLTFQDISNQLSFSVKDNSILSSVVINPEMRQPVKTEPSEFARLHASNAAVPDGYSEAVRITIPQDGVYRISARVLRDSLESNPSIDPNSLRLFHRGVEQPIYIKSASADRFRGSDYLEFIAKVPKNTYPGQYWDPYNAYGIYWLTWGGESGSRFAVKSVEPVSQNPYYLRSFRETVHIEEERYFDRLGGLRTNQYSDQMDLWFHSSALSAGTLTEFPFTIASPDPSSLSDIELTIGLQGLSTEGARNHQAEFFLNNQYLGESPQFTGLESIEVATGTDFPTQDLEDGQNSLGISVLEVDDEYEALTLNWLEISYDRLFVAHDDYLEFLPPPSIVLDRIYEYTLSGFESENIRIYRGDDVMLRDFLLATNDKGQHDITFQTRHFDPSLQYYAASDFGVAKPLDVDYVTWKQGSDNDLETDYLIITPEIFRETAEIWAEYRAAQGWTPEVLSTEDIYRNYSYGYSSPAAIRNAIHQRYSLLPATETLHVLLIGDTKSHLRTAAKIIPMRYYQTEKYGAVVTDYYYANIDTTDLIPEVAVGRIPVQSVVDLETVFDKIQEYEESAPYGEWRNRSLFIAGYDAVFKTQTEELLRYRTGKSIFPERLYIDLTAQQSRFYGGSADLLQYMNTGLYHVNFMGHGGGAVWADRSLFLREDIQRLRNKGMYSFVTSMTCFTGAVESEGGLGELMLTEPEAGSIGWYGSSGLGWIWNDFLLMYDMPEYLQNGEYTLGEIVSLAQINYLARAPRFGYSYLVPSMIHQYNLIGDPATQLAVPEAGESVTLAANNIQSGQELELRSSEDASTIIQVYDAKNIPLYPDGNRHISWETNGSEYEYTIELPDTFSAGQGHIAYYQFSDDNHRNEHGALPFAIDAPVVQNMRTIPSLPKTNQTVRFKADIFPEKPIDSVKVHTNRSATLLSMHQTDGMTWETQHTLAGFSVGTQVQWWLEIYQTSGKIIIGPRRQFQVGFLPNLEVREVEVVHGTTPEIRVVVNSSEQIEESSHPSVTVQMNSEHGDTLLHDVTELNFGTTKYDTIWIPFYNPGGTLALSIDLDSDNLIAEQSETDNQYTSTFRSPVFAVTPELGLTFDGNTHATLEQDSILVSVNGDEISVSGTVSLEFREFVFDEHKWQMDPKLTSGNDPLGIDIAYPTGNAQPFPVEISDTRNNQDSTDHWYYSEDREDGLWLRNNCQGNMTTASASGVYSLFQPSDAIPPVVTASVGDQPYLPEMYVGQTPKIRLLVEDSVAVDTRFETLNIFLDDQPVQQEKTVIRSTGGRQSAVIEVQPELTAGLHSITFTASDIHGNRSESSEYSLLVATDNVLIDYGNFPNPFQSETYFYFEVTNRVSDFTLDIFTVDGRRIMRYSPTDVFMDGDITAPGFHKIRWDGRDQAGEFVSNGVYFYRFTVKIGGKTHNSVGKIAKAR